MSRLTRTPVALIGDPNSQNANINSLIHPTVWAGTTLTYSFPTLASQYTGYSPGEEPFQSFEAAGAPYRTAVKFAFDTVSEFTNLILTEVTPSAANPPTMRFGISADPAPTPGRPAQPDSAGWGYLPANTDTAGDIWIKNNQNINAAFQPGDFRWSLVIHEVGHGLGLGHPFDTGNLGGATVMDPARDSTEYTIMAYRASTTVPSVQTVGFPETGGEPQTWMQYDVAAFQYLYGANFNTRAGNTIYTWNPATGQMSIDGVAYGLAPQVNRILMNIWDGNGTDTYDFSNYTTNVISDLRPGAWSSPSIDQVPITNTQAQPAPAKAPGSISNSLLFNGDLRSLIENASGGTGNDALTGNQADNLLKGNGGSDMLNGLEGNDTLDGGLGIDEASYVFDTLGVAANLFSAIVVQRNGQPNFSVDQLISIENLTGGAGNDFLLGDNTANRLSGQGGGDNLWGFGGNDTLFGGDGDDIIVGGDDNDSLESGLGQDWLYGQGGNDTLRGTDATSNAFNVLVGGDGDDQLFGGPTGFDYFYGGDGATGGGTDTMVISANSGINVMNDFKAGGIADFIQLAGTGITTFAQVQAAMSFSNTINGTVLVVDGNTQVWILGFQPVTLTAGDFLFV